MNITYLTGDATRPVSKGHKIIAHICNDVGAWGAGFVLALSRRWGNKAKSSYQAFGRKKGFKLGTVDFVRVEADPFGDKIWIANMIAQHDIRPHNGVPPIRYSKLQDCLEKVAEEARGLNASVHMPRIGCGLAGGTWNNVEPIIKETLKDVNVFVYDLPK